MNKEFLTVSELNSFIKDVINAGFPQPLWVCGEIQQYDRNKNKKHVFFELVEKNSETKDVTARIGLVIFANKKPFLEEVLKKSENVFELKDDIEVKFACRVDFYAPHGVVRLIVENIDPFYTMGKIAQQKQKLIMELKKEEIFEKNKLLKLSKMPLNIGLITSDNSAAYNDFIAELKKSGFGFKIFLRNTLMQGKNAENDICLALCEISRLNNIDAVVITRGGGSISDLSCFDSRLIAESIASYKLPVLSGIGHEINLTITDLSVHTFAKTPTAIAQFLVDILNVSLADLDNNISDVLESTKQYLFDNKQRLRNNSITLKDGTNDYLKIHIEKIFCIIESIKFRSEAFLDNNKTDILDMRNIIKNKFLARIDYENNKLNSVNRLINALHPYKILKRGFSITRDKITGRVLKSIEVINKDSIVDTEVVDGHLESKVLNIMKGEKK